uniref:Uncharacterized protein n=1 Tax=Tanacetum cinerariifolium TaxID=118510 RepID=A0A6L2LFS2_TANCI|nr:hypothetical protein [Tanacetum cinerariifolium]
MVMRKLQRHTISVKILESRKLNLKTKTSVNSDINDLSSETKLGEGAHVEEGESSRSRALYVPEWIIHQRAWISMSRGALAQTDILERFNNFQENFVKLVETHDVCEEIVKKLVTARVDLHHNAKLYNDMTKRYMKVREEHDSYASKLQVLEREKDDLSCIKNDQAIRIKELEAELAKKDFALVYAERISAEGAAKKEKLVKHMAIQAERAKGLAEGRSEEDITDALRKVEGFDAYSKDVRHV